MATRAFAKMTTDFHDEPSIRALTIDQQWAYELVMKRPDLSRCGVVAYTPRRWARFAHDATEKKLRRLYGQLVQTRHVVIDEETDELFARTYVRHDGLLSQPNVVAAMVSDFQLISSDTIQNKFLVELRRIWDLDLSDGVRGGWLLAMGHYPDANNDAPSSFPDHMTSKSLAVLQRNIGTGLSVQMTQAIQQESVRPFIDDSEKGSPEPFREGSRGRVHAAPAPAPATATATATATSSAAGSARVAEPSPPTDPAPTDPHTPLQHPTHTLALLDEHGRWSSKVRAELAPIVDQLLTDGIPDQPISAGITAWRAGSYGPRYLANLVQDQLTGSSTNGTGPKTRAAKTLELAARLDTLETPR